ncbi:hypothetical protein TRFO_37406 [Tritrichomonas foetus]|uniref:Ubiquitin-like domain-containing protein n=1 Tax=Tritrichomonas foetus TaxID=1144522 RepID=A0A1J4JFK7_9EUKA|nr:hypothetical protein TRFO_37406 [Tritrichomonas foetus]|eukprot:OHS96427.1 hypothetical protein TRFO_37406 [Tritrichomonas foetus]
MITLTLHAIDTSASFTVTVNKLSSLNVLECYFPKQRKYSMFYHNNYLLPSFSFEFYEIKDGDTLYIIQTPQKLKPAIMKKPTIPKIPSDITSEVCRLHDVFFSRAEGNKIGNQRVTNRFKKLLENDFHETCHHEATIICNSDRPSTTMLPFSWKVAHL